MEFAISVLRKVKVFAKEKVTYSIFRVGQSAVDGIWPLRGQSEWFDCSQSS
jgi:hypothetical protein